MQTMPGGGRLCGKEWALRKPIVFKCLVRFVLVFDGRRSAGRDGWVSSEYQRWRWQKLFSPFNLFKKRKKMVHVNVFFSLKVKLMPLKRKAAATCFMFADLWCVLKRLQVISSHRSFALHVEQTGSLQVLICCSENWASTEQTRMKRCLVMK